VVAGFSGDVGAAGAALYQATLKAAHSGDVSGEVHFATWLANGLSVNGMADRAVQLLNYITELARKSGYSEMPLQLSIAKVRALSLLPEPQRARGRDEAKKLISITLETARKNTVMGAQTELLNQAGQLALEEHDFPGAEKSFNEVVQIGKAAGLPREEAEGLLHLSQLYRAENAPMKAAPAIDRGIAVLQSVEEGYDLPVFVAEQAEVQAAFGSLAAADALYERATDLIDGLLVNAQSSRVKTEMIGAMSDIYLGHFRLAWDRRHNAEEALGIVEGARGRALLDSMRYARQTGPITQEAFGDSKITRLQRDLLHTISLRKVVKVENSLS